MNNRVQLQNPGTSQDSVTPISFSIPVFSEIQLGTRLHLNALHAGQVGNLRRIDNPPSRIPKFFIGPIANRPRVTNLPHNGLIDGFSD